MNYAKHILNHASSFGSRSSVLSILAWIFGAILASITISGALKAPFWLLIGLFIILIVLVIAILIAFFYCLFNDKTDILRSEKFNIEKLAIERQASGDDLTGIESNIVSNTLVVLPVESVEEEEE